MRRRHVYGPVPSRRLGLSLGVDLVPFKVCSYDCTYCQLGPTTELTVSRRDFQNPTEVLDDVEQALREGPTPDVITLAGSGEPTLYRSLGLIIEELRRISPVPLVLITNGSLLADPEVAEQAAAVDVLVPSLDAGDEETFQRINRPHPDVDFGRMVQGLQQVGRRRGGKLRMEVMLCAGINDSPESLRGITEQLSGVPLEAIEINTPVRPGGADRQVAPPTAATLALACELLGPRARCIGRYHGRHAAVALHEEQRQRILELVSRRPASRADLEAALGIGGNELIKLLNAALAEGSLRAQKQGEQVYYIAGSTADSGGGTV